VTSGGGPHVTPLQGFDYGEWFPGPGPGLVCEALSGLSEGGRPFSSRPALRRRIDEPEPDVHRTGLEGVSHISIDASGVSRRGRPPEAARQLGGLRIHSGTRHPFRSVSGHLMSDAIEMGWHSTTICSEFRLQAAWGVRMDETIFSGVKGSEIAEVTLEQGSGPKDRGGDAKGDHRQGAEYTDH